MNTIKINSVLEQQITKHVDMIGKVVAVTMDDDMILTYSDGRFAYIVIEDGQIVLSQKPPHIGELLDANLITGEDAI